MVPGASPRALHLGSRYSSGVVTCRCLASRWFFEVCLCMALSCKAFVLTKIEKDMVLELVRLREEKNTFSLPVISNMAMTRALAEKDTPRTCNATVITSRCSSGQPCAWRQCHSFCQSVLQERSDALAIAPKRHQKN
jgi:hypothetical protein